MAGLVIVGISNLSGKPGEVLGGGEGGKPCNVLASHPGRRGVVVILLVTLCWRNQEKVQQVGPLGLSTNFFFSSTYTLYIHNFVTSFWHEPYIRRIGNILAPSPKESSAMSYRCEIMQLDCFFNQLFMCYLYTDLIDSLHCKIKSHELTDRSKASLTSNMNKGKHYKSVIQCIAGRKLLNSDFCS